jgi:hypothetical protein
MRQAAGIKGGMLFQETSGKASDEQEGQQGHPWDDKRPEFFFFHNGITALRCAVQQDVARRWHTHAAGPKRRQQLSIAERFILKAGYRSGALNMV